MKYSIEYELRRSSRRSISIEVTRDLAVVVRAPNRTSVKEIDKFIEDRAEWIIKQTERLKALKEAYPELGEAETKLLAEIAREYITSRVLYWSERMQLYPASVKITRAKTRYGSCSAKNALCFSCYLMRCRPEAIDYVVVHELSHIVHKNHGAAFYGLISEYLPDYKARRSLLTSL